MKKFLKRLFCKHIGQSRLIFGIGKHTHYDIETCIKCGKRLSKWSGTRDEWYQRNGFNL